MCLDGSSGWYWAQVSQWIKRDLPEFGSQHRSRIFWGKTPLKSFRCRGSSVVKPQLSWACRVVDALWNHVNYWIPGNTCMRECGRYGQQLINACFLTWSSVSSGLTSANQHRNNDNHSPQQEQSILVGMSRQLRLIWTLRVCVIADNKSHHIPSTKLLLCFYRSENITNARDKYYL